MCDKHGFVFDVDKAYADQLVNALEDSPVHPLAASEAPSTMGVYALYLDRNPRPVYVGKADSARDGALRRRLREHTVKIHGRQNIDLGKVSCRYLTIAQRWEVARAEDALIKHYDPSWNEVKGFGRHVPGVGRPGKPGYVNQWDTMFPLTK